MMLAVMINVENLFHPADILPKISCALSRGSHEPCGKLVARILGMNPTPDDVAILGQ